MSILQPTQSREGALLTGPCAHGTFAHVCRSRAAVATKPGSSVPTCSLLSVCAGVIAAAIKGRWSGAFWYLCGCKVGPSGEGGPGDSQSDAVPAASELCMQMEGNR